MVTCLILVLLYRYLYIFMFVKFLPQRTGSEFKKNECSTQLRMKGVRELRGYFGHL